MRSQYIRLGNCVSGTVISSNGAPPGTVIAPLLFSLKMVEFKLVVGLGYQTKTSTVVSKSSICYRFCLFAHQDKMAVSMVSLAASHCESSSAATAIIVCKAMRQVEAVHAVSVAELACQHSEMPSKRSKVWLYYMPVAAGTNKCIKWSYTSNMVKGPVLGNTKKVSNEVLNWYWYCVKGTDISTGIKIF